MGQSPHEVQHEAGGEKGAASLENRKENFNESGQSKIVHVHTSSFGAVGQDAIHFTPFLDPSECWKVR